MVYKYGQKRLQKVWEKITRTKQPIERKDAKDFPFEVNVTGNKDNINIQVVPNVKATTNEVIPIVSKTVMLKVEAFEKTPNTPGNRERLTKELTLALTELWVQGLIEPAKEGDKKEEEV